jgi:hypothetical protein
MPEHAQGVGEQRRQAQSDQHQGEHEVAGVAGVAMGSRRADGRHGHDDRRHGQVLAPTRGLVEQPLAHQHQHEQSRRERRLDDDQRGQQQRHHVQWPAKDRHPGTHQPAGAHDQLTDETHAQVVAVRDLASVHRLQRHP